MKLLVLTAAFCALVVSGCGGGSDAADPSPTATVTETATVDASPTPEPVDSAEPRVPDPVPFKLALIPARKQAPMLAMVPDATIAGAARAECNAFDRGVSARKILMTAVQSDGVTPDTAGAIFTLGVYSFCPEHIAEARAFLDTLH